MIQVNDSIESSGYPLGFRFRQGAERPPVFAGQAGETVFRVDARAMGVHQKEALIHEGPDGPVWRAVSDEGPSLKGSDLAPFPLGFFNAGLQSDLLGRLGRLASTGAAGIDLALDTVYSFSGSFMKSDGRGTAGPAAIRLEVTGDVDASTTAGLVRRAMAESPAIAALTTALDNTFAIYVNGVRREVTMTSPSPAADAADPLRTYRQPPAPAGNPADAAGLIVKLRQQDSAAGLAPASAVKLRQQDSAAGLAPASADQRGIRVAGRASAFDMASLRFNVQTGLMTPAGSRFGFATDEAAGSGAAAPSGLALLSAGIAFCYMTQLLRYAEYLKYRVRAIRVVQYAPYRVEDRGGAMLGGGAGPVDTHLFLHGDEPDDVMQKLLVVGARTCYLHAALGTAMPPQVALTLNGRVVAVD